jgi:hypothetical protein
MSMDDQSQTPERPPTSGPGSGADAWRAYAAAVTDSPLESWTDMSRDEIIARLDEQGTEAELTETEQEASRPAPAGEPGRPLWMVPTADGWVPEIEQR